MAENWVNFLQLGSREQRQVLVHEDKETHRKDNIDGCYPAADLEFLALFVWRNLVEGHIGREAESAESKRHGVTQSDDAASDGPSHPLVFFRGTIQIFAMSRD